MRTYLNNTLLLAFALLAATACNRFPDSPMNEMETPVSVQEVQKGNIVKCLQTTGNATAAATVELTAQTSGEYQLQTNPKTGKRYRLGDAIEKGTVIIRLQDEAYVNEMAIDAKRLNLEIAEQKLEKQQALYEKGGVTLNEIRSSEVEITNARYAYENAKINLEKLTVRAPFSGVIVNLPIYTQGVRVESGKPMVDIMDYTALYLETNFPESAIPALKAGQSVFITHYTIPQDTLYGRVEELSPAINTETRTFKGKIRVDNASGKLHPGMFVKADVAVDKADSVLVIPKEVVLSERSEKYVYIADKGGVASYRAIKTGLEDEYSIQVIEGLKELDNLIVKGFETLRDGSKIKIQQ